MTEAAQTREHPGQPMIGIVDDDESVRLALANWLRSIGIASRTFASGADLLESGLLVRFCCLILDQRMRGMTGLETLRAVRLRGCAVPVIMISAHNDPETRQRAGAAGAFAFVDKPFADLSLMEVVLNALDLECHGRPRPVQ